MLFRDLLTARLIFHLTPRLAVNLLTAAGAPSQAGTGSSASKRPAADGSRSPGEPAAADDRVIVKFHSTKAAAAVAARQASTPVVGGLKLARFIGKYQHWRPTSRGKASSPVPTDASMVFQITDGSTVASKIKELKNNPGQYG